MKNAGIVWTEYTIRAYLKAPKTFLKGNRMAFGGIKKDEQRDDSLAYPRSASTAK